MAVMTEEQYQLGLAMMAADIHAALSLPQRSVAIRVLQTNAEVPAFYRHKIHAYLDARKAKREETTHADY